MNVTLEAAMAHEAHTTTIKQYHNKLRSYINYFVSQTVARL